MKRMMSRMLALIVAMIILVLPSAALAEERNFYTLTVGNFELTYEGETIVLPVDLSIGAAADIEGERGALIASLGTDGQLAASALATLENGEIRATLEGLGYNLYVPMEQLMELVEEEMGGSLEEAIASEMDPEMTAMMEKLMNAYVKMIEEAMNADPAAYTSIALPEEYYTVEGEEEITLYDVTMTASKLIVDTGDLTMNEILDLSSGTGAAKEYMDAYMEFMEYMIAQEGSDITLEEAFDLITMCFTGVVYTAENAVMGEIDMIVTVEGDSLTIPMSIAALGDDESLLMDFVMPITVDGETMTMQMSMDALDNEEMTSVLFDVAMIVSEDDEISDIIQLGFATIDDADGVALSIAITVDDGVDTVAMALDYAGTHITSTADADSWDGSLMLSVQEGEELMSIAMSTNLTASILPEGELLAPTEGDLNALELTDENVESLTVDAQNVLIQALGVLMQDPTIAEMIVDMM